MTKRYDKELNLQDLARIEDDQIDTSDIPELDEEFWKKARVSYPTGMKQQLTVRLDPDVVQFFKAQGKGYQTRMNAVLRAYVAAHREP